MARLPLQPTVDHLAGIDAHAARLMREMRVLFLVGAISAGDAEDEGEWGTAQLIRSMLALDRVNSKRPIHLLINSVGGEITSGLAVVDAIQYLIRPPVYTYVIGEAASMAAVILAAGARRFAFPHVRILLHRGKWAAEGDREDIRIVHDELRVLDEYCNKVLIARTKIKKAHLEELQRKDFWMGAGEALKWGLVDEVLDDRTKAGRLFHGRAT